MKELKQQLYKLCAGYITSREDIIKQAIADAREAASNETKSSAGDKYETGREMMQQEIDLNMTRLNELNRLKQILDHITPEQTYTTAQPGAIILTSNGNYFIAISAGQLKVDETIYYAISIASPIGTKLIGLKAGDTFILNNKTIQVTEVC